MHEDGYWLERIRRGDHSAFAELYHKYSGTLYRAVAAITRDHAAAEEILQESFVRLYRHAARLDLERSTLPWLHRVALNLTYNWLVRERLRCISLDDLVAHWHSSSRLEIERTVEQQERADSVREAVARLGFEHRVVVVLYYLEGFSLAEIAGILGIPVGTAKSRLHYARKALERRLLNDLRFGAEIAYEPL